MQISGHLESSHFQILSLPKISLFKKFRPIWIFVDLHVIWLFIFLLKKLLIWLHWVLAVVGEIFSCSTWDLVPSPGIEPDAPASRARSLGHWTTREVPHLVILISVALLKGLSIQCTDITTQGFDS